MTPLVLHAGAAHDLLAAVLIGRAAAELLLRLANLGGRTALDWTFLLVVGFVAFGINLAFRVAHLSAAENEFMTELAPEALPSIRQVRTRVLRDRLEGVLART